jgi:hypothetical protein
MKAVSFLMVNFPIKEEIVVGDLILSIAIDFNLTLVLLD